MNFYELVTILLYCKQEEKTSKLAYSSFMPLNCRSLIVTSGQVLGGIQHYGCFSRNSCSYHWFTSVFSPSLRRRMWRDEIKAYQVDKSIKLVALLWHEALKARSFFLCVQERAHFFLPAAFLRLSICAGLRVARAQSQHGERKKARDLLLQKTNDNFECKLSQHPEL